MSYLVGAGARRSRGVSFEDPLDHYWSFIENDDEYLTCANIDAMEANNFTVVAAMAYDADQNMDVVSMYDVNDQKTWSLCYRSSSFARGYTGRNSCSDFSSTQGDPDVGWAQGAVALIALSFEYSGNPGAEDSDRGAYVVRGGAVTKEDHVLTVPGPIPDCTGPFSIGRTSGVEILSMDGDIYWVAYYPSVLTGANLIDLEDGTLHPGENFNPVMYIDFSKPVAATYTTEVGGYVLNVVGTPTQGPQA